MDLVDTCILIQLLSTSAMCYLSNYFSQLHGCIFSNWEGISVSLHFVLDQSVLNKRCL